jgi:hypothetical protein
MSKENDPFSRPIRENIEMASNQIKQNVEMASDQIKHNLEMGTTMTNSFIKMSGMLCKETTIAFENARKEMMASAKRKEMMASAEKMKGSFHTKKR